jgi:hypothetical protein
MEIITGLNGGGWELARPSPSGRRRQVSRSQVQHIPGFVPGTAVDPLDRQGQRPSRVAPERRGAADGSYPARRWPRPGSAAEAARPAAADRACLSDPRGRGGVFHHRCLALAAPVITDTGLTIPSSVFALSEGVADRSRLPGACLRMVAERPRAGPTPDLRVSRGFEPRARRERTARQAPVILVSFCLPRWRRASAPIAA